jgi:hypothetical protein
MLRCQDPTSAGATMLATHANEVGQALSATQLAAIRAMRQLFVEDDLAAGVAPDALAFCEGCVALRPEPGSVHCERYLLCNACSTEYEIARATRVVASVGQYVSGKLVGECEADEAGDVVRPHARCSGEVRS